MKTKTRERMPPLMLHNRPNKIAQGMTATNERRKGGRRYVYSDEALMLSVRGTTDKLTRGLFYRTTRNTDKKCPCCGQLVKLLRLNDRGRYSLRILRARRANRAAMGES